MASIFVQIAAFQDYELPRTIKDCILKSSKENDIYFGVHLCEISTMPVPMSEYKNVRIKKSVAPDNLGVGTARYIANEFYNGEDYYLQIDSHMRFDQDWDKELIAFYNEYKKENLNPVITAYPGIYEYKDKELVLTKTPGPSYIDFHKTEQHQNEFKINKILPQKGNPNIKNNIFTKSVSGAWIFSSGEIAKIKPNKKMYNWGEETLTAVRLFTHGFDLLIPKKELMYHLYYDHDNDSRNQRILPQKLFKTYIDNIVEESNIELARIINYKIIGDQEMGSVRTLEEYEYYAGVDFSSGKIV